MIKTLVVFGTRPEAIKMCPVILEMKKNNKIEPIVCLTGQHREMLNQVMDVFNIKADYNLDIMKDGQTLDDITSNVMFGIKNVIQEVSPDIMLVHGDTTTSFAAALEGFYENIIIGHIEAGLRTYDMKSPYPEEFNRQAVDLVSTIYFAPTDVARDNLIKEGKSVDDIIVTGNTVIDALNFTVDHNYSDENLEWAKGSRLILLTAHRRENLGDAMRGMFRAIKRVINSNENVKCIYPVHRNPLVVDVANEVLGNDERIRLIDPLDVNIFHNYINSCYLVVTDSGGIQEEAPSLDKPVLVMRNTTERPEGLKAGTLKLIGVNEENIYNSIQQILDDEEEYRTMSKAINPYGDGKASERIVQELIRRFE